MKRRSFFIAAASGLMLARRAHAASPASPPASFYGSKRAAVMVSGGTISTPTNFSAAVRTVQRDLYPPSVAILLIINASLPADRDAMERRLKGYYAADGFDAESLHHYSGADARRKLSSALGVFVGGGETYLLLRDLAESGLLGLLRERVLDGLPYHGTSAGANLAGPVIGCSNDFPVVDIPSRTALGVFPAVINPHHPKQGDSDYAARAAKIRGYRRVNPGETVLGIGNGAIAQLTGSEVNLRHGPGFLYGPTSKVLAEGPVPELSKPA
jgi:dipeptidase E